MCYVFYTVLAVALPSLFFILGGANSKGFYTVKVEHGVRSIITLKQELLTKSNYLLNYNVKKYFLNNVQ